jgi:hypothetical protein
VATTVEDVDELIESVRVDAVYHAAFAPEVEWAVPRLDGWRTQHGAIRRISMAFADAYTADLSRATATLGDSWTDGGINALSVLARLTDPTACTGLRRLEGPSSTFTAAITCRETTASILTTWAAAEPSKSTTVAFEDDAMLVLDHQAVLGRLEIGGRIVDHFAASSPQPRLVQHYVGCFRRLLVDGQRSFPVDTDRLLHRLLLEPGREPSDPTSA